MRVAILIVGFRNSGDIMRCLAALQQSTYQDFEVMICENGGANAYAELVGAVQALPQGGANVRIRQAESNRGFAAGVNICLRETQLADAWWILNPDTEPDKAALDALVKRLQRGDCDAVGGTLYFTDDKVQCHGGAWQSWIARAVAIGIGDSATRIVNDGDVQQRLDYLSGASMLIGRRFFQVVGPMREDYFLYCEEVEWFLRSQKLGMRLGFTSSARVVHHQGTSTGNSKDVVTRSWIPVYLDERNRLLVTRDLFPLRFPVVAITSLMMIMLRYGQHRAWRQLGFACSGWFAGLRNERGIPRRLSLSPIQS